MKLISSFVFLATALLALPSFGADKKADGTYNESEAGVVITGGNTQTQTVALKHTTEWIQAHNTYKANAAFLRSSNAGIEQARIWGLGVRYERGLTDDFSLYIGQLVESNYYQNILQRYGSDIGGKYIWMSTESLKWFSELGYRFARENYRGGTPANLSFLRAYNELEYTFSKSVSTKWWFEVLPNLSNFDGYQFNTELSFAAALSDVFSIKSAYFLRYNNAPPAPAFKTDTAFTTALVAKF
jgi:putative salt-induced outer membrane protein YdiY